MQHGKSAGIDGLDGLRRRVAGQQRGGDVGAEGGAQGTHRLGARPAVGQPIVAQDDVGPLPECLQLGEQLVGVRGGGQAHAPLVEHLHHGAQDGLVVVDEGDQGVFQG